MESLFSAISSVETELNLIDNLVHNIYVYELPKGDLVINLKFENSRDYEEKLIGGLSATINEFAEDHDAKIDDRVKDISNETGSEKEEPENKETDDSKIPENKIILRSIHLEEVNFIFTTARGYLIVFAVDTNYSEPQFTDAIQNFVDSFKECMNYQDYGSSMDGAAIAIQTIHTLISEDISIDVEIGPKVTIYPFKLRELAAETAEKVLGMSGKEVDLYDESSTSEPDEEVMVPEEIQNPEDAMNKMLKQFTNTFAQIKQITLIRTNLDGSFQEFTHTRLPKDVEERVYKIVMEMIDTVSLILEEEDKERMIDLEERIIFFHKVSDYSFLYLVVKDEATVDLIIPIVERIAKSLVNLFPDDMQI